MGGACGGGWCSSGGRLRMGQWWWGCDGGGKGEVHCEVLVVFIIGVAIIFMVIMAATTMVTMVVVGMENMVKVR